MSKLKLTLYLCGIILFTCCTNKEKTECLKLKGNSLDIDFPFMRYPYRVDLDSNRMVLFDLASDSLLYHIVSYPDFQYCYSLGKKGDAPMEITLSTPCQIKDGYLMILDGAKGDLYRYKMDRLLSASFEKQQKLPVMRTVDFVCKNDSTIIVEDMSGECRLLEIAPSYTKKLFSIPSDNAKKNATDGYLWRSFMTYNPALDMIALASQFGNVLEIYNLTDSLSTVIVGDGGEPRATSQLQGFQDVKWVGEFVYALYSGRSMDELNRKFDAGQKEPDGGNLIKVFDASGILVKCYELDTYINGFAVDETQRQLIGISSNSDNPILLFDLI